MHRTIENNIWQQFNFSIPVKRSSYFGWIRLEQRWQTQNNDKSYSARIRFRTGFRFPLRQESATFSPQFVVFNEVFLKLETTSPMNSIKTGHSLVFSKPSTKK